MSIKFKKGDKVLVISSSYNCKYTAEYTGHTGVVLENSQIPYVKICGQKICFNQEELILIGEQIDQETSDIKTALLIAIKQLDLSATSQDKVLSDRLELILKKMES